MTLLQEFSINEQIAWRNGATSTTSTSYVDFSPGDGTSMNVTFTKVLDSSVIVVELYTSCFHSAAGAVDWGVRINGTDYDVIQGYQDNSGNHRGYGATKEITGIAIEDSFTRADSASSLGTATSGQTWSANKGTWGVSSNQAYLVASGVGDINTAVVETGMSDCVVGVESPTGAWTSSGLCFRCSDANNFWVTVVSTPLNILYLYSVVAGVPTERASASYTGAANDRMSVQLSGSMIDVAINGVVKFTFDSSILQTATKHGLYVFNSSTPRFDNFTVSGDDTVSIAERELLAAGEYTITVRWRTSGGTATTDVNDTQSLVVREKKVPL